MLYRVASKDGKILDAHFEVDGTDLVFHSRGGTKGKDARNSDYGVALRLLLERLRGRTLKLVSIWVDSSAVQAIPLAKRLVFAAGEDQESVPKLFTKISARIAAVGHKPGSAAVGGNQTKRLRLRLSAAPTESQISRVLGGRRSDARVRHLDRLPVEALEKVTPDFIWLAVQQLSETPEATSFSESTGFDLLCDNGLRLPPKAVFGLAATRALSFKVLPRHFSGGLGTPCFRLLGEAGYEIVAKGAPSALTQAPLTDGDEEWDEGAKKLFQHYRRERGRGLSRAKKAAFLKEHGKLFCERCKFIPGEKYALLVADASIEVHHRAVAVSKMAAGHKTRLKDLECLCANCHRITHRELRNELLAAPS